MKIKITTEQHPAFLNAVQQAESVSQTSKTVIQALGAVLITAKLGAVTIQANNLEQAIAINVKATVNSPGEFGVSAKDLSRIVKLGKSLEIDVKETEAVIKCGGMFCLSLIMAAEFPVLPVMPDDAKEFEMTCDEMQSILRVGYAASVNDTRYVLQGVCVNPETRQGVASDGRRMALSSFPMLDGEIKPIFPTALCRILDSILGASENLKLGVSEAHIVAFVGEVTLFSRLVEGNYPNISNVITEPKFTIKINRKNLMAGIDRAIIAQSEHNSIKLDISKAELSLTVKGKNANAETQVDLEDAAPKEAIGFTISVDSVFLREAANAMLVDVISLEFSDSLTPMAIRAESYAVIMPRRTT